MRACEQAAVTTLSGVAREEEGDTLYAIDRVAEHVLIEEIRRTMATQGAPVILVAEGLPGGEVGVPEGADRGAARWVIIVDPIDGTRGLMYQKRPAWILTGVASGPGPRTLADIELAVQTEIPLVKQHLCDEIWAVRGEGASALRVNRLTGESLPLDLRPSSATTIEHGFATICHSSRAVEASSRQSTTKSLRPCSGLRRGARRSRSRIRTSRPAVSSTS